MDETNVKRVGAMVSASRHEVLFLGYGNMVGYEIPPETIGGCNFGLPTPKIVLDNGDVVWGCECWWDEEETIKSFMALSIATGAVVKDVVISDYRK